MEPVKLYTPKEAAALLGTTTKTLSGHRNNGTGCAFLKLGTHRKSSVRYRSDDLQAYIDSFERKNSAQ